MKSDQGMSQEDEDVLFGGASDIPSLARSAGGGQGDNTLQLNTLDYSSDPLINKLRTVRDNLTNCPQLWAELAQLCPDRRALYDAHLCDEKLDISFAQMNDIVQKSATVFADLGVKKGNNVAVLGENSARWLVADHGIQRAGGASAVRGADAPLDELRYIYEHSDSAAIVVLQGPKLLKKLAKDAAEKGLTPNAGPLGLYNNRHGPVRSVILLNRERTSDEDISRF